MSAGHAPASSLRVCSTVPGKGASSWVLGKASFGIFLHRQKHQHQERRFSRDTYVAAKQSDFPWVSAKEENQLSSIPKIKAPWSGEKKKKGKNSSFVESTEFKRAAC